MILAGVSDLRIPQNSIPAFIRPLPRPRVARRYSFGRRLRRAARGRRADGARTARTHPDTRVAFPVPDSNGLITGSGEDVGIVLRDGARQTRTVRHRDGTCAFK